MPPIRGNLGKWRRFKRRHAGNKSAVLATRPRFMSRRMKFKRMNQVQGRVFYFKRNSFISADLAGNAYTYMSTRQLNDIQTQPVGWDALKLLFDQYKVLAMKVRMFPANVGVEPDSSVFAANALFRGDTIVWSDQRFDPVLQNPTSISEVINYASARMINSRAPYTRTIYRAKGYPGWANTRGPPTQDPWNASIEIITNNATPSTPQAAGPTLWYYTVQWKVLVRGRIQT